MTSPSTLNQLIDLDRLAERVARTGIARNEQAVQRFAIELSRAGVAPLLTGILLDPTAPDAARARAFGRATLEARRRFERVLEAV